MWISKERFEAFEAAIRGAHHTEKSLNEELTRVALEQAAIRGELRVAQALLEEAQRQVRRLEAHECPSAVTAPPSLPTVNAMADAAVALQRLDGKRAEGEEKPERAPTPSFMDRLDDVFGGGLSNEQIAALHPRAEKDTDG